LDTVMPVNVGGAGVGLGRADHGAAATISPKFCAWARLILH
jgi:hypothetical protein